MDKKFFNIYYINYSKVFEIAMMIDNHMLAKKAIENFNSNEEKRERSQSVTLGMGIGFWGEIKALLRGSTTKIRSNSHKMSQEFDVKNTKSTFLREVLKLSSSKAKFDQNHIGQIVELSGVAIKPYDLEEYRNYKILRGNALKGLTYEGLEINNLVNSFLSDYAYVLVGEAGESQNKFLMKIPMDAGSEFENGYSIDDLLIGKLSVIGIYRGIVSVELVTANTMTSLTAQENLDDEIDSKVFSSDKENTESEKIKSSLEKNLPFIDLVAIVQNLVLPITEPKLPFWKRIFPWFRGNKPL